jgi:hypothetical protein
MTGNDNPEINLHRHFIGSKNIVSLFERYGVHDVLYFVLVVAGDQYSMVLCKIVSTGATRGRLCVY